MFIFVLFYKFLLKYKKEAIVIILMYSWYWLGRRWLNYGDEPVDMFWSHILVLPHDWYVYFKSDQIKWLIISIVFCVASQRNRVYQWLSSAFLLFNLLDCVWFKYNFCIDKNTNYWTIYVIWLSWDTFLFWSLVWRRKKIPDRAKQ